MNSSLAAILASPVSGVSGAVTGYPIGRGNGVSTVFAAPPEITAISALYCRDWQGTVALSPSARTNYAVNAVWAGGTPPTSWTQYLGGTGTITAATSTLSAGAGALLFAAVAAGDRTYIRQSFTMSAGVAYRVSVWIERLTGSVRAPHVLNDNVGDLVLSFPACPANPTGGMYEDIQPGRLDMIITYAAGGSHYVYIGLGVTAGAPGISSVRLSRPTFRLDSEVQGVWIPTTTAPVTLTDYTASGTTLTLAEAPALAAELTVDGTGVNLPLLQIGGY